MKNHLHKISLIILLAVFGFGKISMGQTENVDSEKKISIRYSLVDNDKIFLGTWYDGVYLSVDSGQVFLPVNNGLPQKSTLIGMVKHGDAIFVSYKDGIYYTINNGKTWTATSAGIGYGDIKDMKLFKGQLYAATTRGLFVKNMNEFSWSLVMKKVTDEVTEILATDNFIVASVYTAKYETKYYSSSDGVKWNIVKGLEGISPSFQIHGNYIYATKCFESDVTNGYYCRRNTLYILSDDGKEFLYDKLGRTFIFGNDTVCAINAMLYENDNKYSFEVTVFISPFGGKYWKEIDPTTHPYITSNIDLQEAIAEEYGHGLHEIKQSKALSVEIEQLKKQVAEREAYIKKSRAEAVITTYGNTDYSRYKSSTDYQKLSNERFKESNNHTDSWIDSNGKAHIH